jgi:hypothetical protein
LSFTCKEVRSTPTPGSPSLQAMIEHSMEEFYTASRGEGSSGLPVSQRLSVGVPPAPIATTPWLKDALATQAMLTVSILCVNERISFCNIVISEAQRFAANNLCSCSIHSSRTVKDPNIQHGYHGSPHNRREGGSKLPCETTTKKTVSGRLSLL